MFMNWTVSYLQRQFPDVPGVDTTKTQEMIEEGKPMLIVDCRKEDEYQVSKIPGAKHVHFQCTDQVLKEALNESCSRSGITRIVSYCSLGYRSAIMTKRIMEMVQKDPSLSAMIPSDQIYNLEGSIFKWASEDKALVDNHELPTK